MHVREMMSQNIEVVDRYDTLRTVEESAGRPNSSGTSRCWNRERSWAS